MSGSNRAGGPGRRPAARRSSRRSSGRRGRRPPPPGNARRPRSCAARVEVERDHGACQVGLAEEEERHPLGVPGVEREVIGALLLDPGSAPEGGGSPRPRPSPATAPATSVSAGRPAPSRPSAGASRPAGRPRRSAVFSGVVDRSFMVSSGRCTRRRRGSQGAERPARRRVDRVARLRVAAELEAEQPVVVVEGRGHEVLVVVADGVEGVRGGREGVQGGEVGRDVREGAEELPGLGRLQLPAARPPRPPREPIGVPGGRRRVGRLGGGRRGVRAAGRAARDAPARVDRRDHRLVEGRVRAARERLGHPEGGLDGLPTALPLRVPLGQLREGLDPAGAAGGERDDRPERQCLRCSTVKSGSSMDTSEGRGRWSPVDGLDQPLGRRSRVQSTGHGSAPQTSAAYSAIVRSLENLPECPTLRIAFRAQASGCL